MKDRKPIESLSDIPEFLDEEEEAEFWERHSFGEGVLRDGRRGHPPRVRELLESKGVDPEKRRILVSAFGPETVRRLERVGELRGEEPSDIAREFVLRRLEEEERRAGISGG